MTRLTWDSEEDKIYHSGVDRAVIFVNEDTYSWSGLTKISSDVDSGSLDAIYYNGQKTGELSETSDLSGSITAYTYPDIIEKLSGYVELVSGAMGDGSVAKYFAMSYRTMINSTDYRLHFIPMMKIKPVSPQFETEADELTATEFEWNFSAVKYAFRGAGMLTHLYFDSNKVDPTILQALEDAMYGTDTMAPQGFTAVIGQIRNIANRWDVVESNVNSWIISGSAEYVTFHGDETWTLEA